MSSKNTTKKQPVVKKATKTEEASSNKSTSTMASPKSGMVRHHPRRIRTRVDRYGDGDTRKEEASEVKNSLNNTIPLSDIKGKKRKLLKPNDGNCISHLLLIKNYPDCLNNYNITLTKEIKSKETINLLSKLNSISSFSIPATKAQPWSNLLLPETSTKHSIPESKIKELKKKGYVLSKNYQHAYNLMKVSSQQNYIVLLDHGYVIWILYASTHLLVVDKFSLKEGEEVLDLCLWEDLDRIYLIVCFGDALELYNINGFERVWRVDFEEGVYVDCMDVNGSGIVGCNSEKEGGVPCVYVSLDGRVVRRIQPVELYFIVFVCFVSFFSVFHSHI